jgi:hypothetical protein
MGNLIAFHTQLRSTMPTFRSVSYYLHKYQALRFEKRNPDKPWLNKQAIDTFDTLLLPSDLIVECGSGRSTAWFCKKTANVISIENDLTWYNIVKQQLADKGCTNVDYRFAEYSFDGDQEKNDYIRQIQSLPDNSVDVCLIDGGPRSYCGLELLPKLKSGGIMAIDDAHHYFPSNSRSVNAFRTEAKIPSMWKGKTKLAFPELWQIVKGWRKLWTSDHLKDTVFFFKP